MPFTRPPQLAYLGRGRYQTVGPTVYHGDRESLIVPSGFDTDLASVPRAFWALVPPSGAYEQAAVLHDYLCTELARQRRAEALELQVSAAPDAPVNARDTDGLFRRVMREAGVPFATRWVMWAGVRWGALVTPARRAGWWRDAPAVLAITSAAAVNAAAALVAFHLAVSALLALAA
jgi:hypothetical protein